MEYDEWSDSYMLGWMLSDLGDIGLSMDYLQSMTWDHNTESLYWAQFYPVSLISMDTNLVKLDPATAKAEIVGRLSYETAAMFAPLTEETAAKAEHANVPDFDRSVIPTPVLSMHNLTMGVGGTSVLDVNFDPWYADDKDIVWTSSDESVAVVDETKKLLTITDNGMGKRTEFADFREMKNRGGKGVSCQNINDKTGKLAAIITVADDDDIMLITNDGVIIRTSVSSVNVYSRTAAGVIVMRLDEGSSIINLARLDREEDIEAAERQAELDGERVVDDEGEEKPAEPFAGDAENTEAEGDEPESAEVDE